jgi:hypothetical protein
MQNSMARPQFAATSRACFSATLPCATSVSTKWATNMANEHRKKPYGDSWPRILLLPINTFKPVVRGITKSLRSCIQSVTSVSYLHDLRASIQGEWNPNLAVDIAQNRGDSVNAGTYRSRTNRSPALPSLQVRFRLSMGEKHAERSQSFRPEICRLSQSCG